MASNRYATQCFPDALLHGRDLLHWQTPRRLSGLGLLLPESSSSADLLFGASQFEIAYHLDFSWLELSHEGHFFRKVHRQPTCSSAPPSFSSTFPGSSKERLIVSRPALRRLPVFFSLPWVIKGTPHLLQELETRNITPDATLSSSPALCVRAVWPVVGQFKDNSNTQNNPSPSY